MPDFNGRSVLLTGAAGGIGTAIAEAFSSSGARLALVDINDVTDPVDCLPGDHRAWHLDLMDPEAISRTVIEIGDTFGIDVLINNAGLGMAGKAEDQSVEDWDLTHAIFAFECLHVIFPSFMECVLKGWPRQAEDPGGR